MIRRALTLVALPMLLILKGCGRDDADDALRLASEASFDLVEDRFDEAFQKLEHAVILRPDVAEYHTGLGIAAVRLGRLAVATQQYESAERILSREAEDDPERVDDHVLILALLGRAEEAKQALSNGLARFPDSQTLQRLDSAHGSLLAGFSEFAITKVEPADAPE